jgi:hypothetical protein
MQSNGRGDLLGGLRDAALQVTVAHPHIVTTIDTGWGPAGRHRTRAPAIFGSVVRGPGTIF